MVHKIKNKSTDGIGFISTQPCLACISLLDTFRTREYEKTVDQYFADSFWSTRSQILPLMASIGVNQKLRKCILQNGASDIMC